MKEAISQGCQVSRLESNLITASEVAGWFTMSRLTPHLRDFTKAPKADKIRPHTHAHSQTKCTDGITPRCLDFFPAVEFKEFL